MFFNIMVKIKGQSKKIALILLGILIAVFGTIYIYFYKSPAIRYNNDLYSISYSSDRMREYTTNERKILIIFNQNNTEIHFKATSQDDVKFTVYEQEAELKVRDSQQIERISGIWKNGNLYNYDGNINSTYQELKEKQQKHLFQNRYSTTNVQKAEDALYIYKAFPDGIRGGGRAPMLIFILFILSAYILNTIDSGAIWEPSMKYSKELLRNWGEKEKSMQAKKIEKKLLYFSIGFLIIAVVILIYDLVAY